jgi:hypothetical protein
MIAASEFDRVVYPEYAIPTAGMIPQPESTSASAVEKQNQVLPIDTSRMEWPTGLDIQKTQHTSTNSVSIRSHASQALSTSAGRPIASAVDDEWI